MKNCFVYIMSNVTGMLYVGVTSNLEGRVYQHKMKLVPGFTARYNLTQLVYYDWTEDMMAAITREKQIKGWTRAKKVALINSVNPGWKDLSLEWEDKTTSFPFSAHRLGTTDSEVNSR